MQKSPVSIPSTRMLRQRLLVHHYDEECWTRSKVADHCFLEGTGGGLQITGNHCNLTKASCFTQGCYIPWVDAKRLHASDRFSAKLQDKDGMLYMYRALPWPMSRCTQDRYDPLRIESIGHTSEPHIKPTKPLQIIYRLLSRLLYH